MAINSIGISRDNNTKSVCSSNTSNMSSCRLIKINFAEKDNIINGLNNKQKPNKDTKSPYLSSDKVQLLGRVTEKRLVHKKPTNSDFTSSFPLAVNVYKANSDEFKLSRRSNKKVKKSVLTLPNAPAPIPKTYTVSDMNDSEYLEDTNDRRPNKSKKRRSIKRNKKYRVKDEEMEFYDRDARYCSQLNINLDCSSTDLMNFTGDERRGSKKSYEGNSPINVSNDPHNVWAVLRNINRLQFRPSPPGSQESIVPLRKRRPTIRKGSNRTDTRIIETCHTEEFAYISSFEIDSKSQDSCSLSSSFDRITVIDKQDEQGDILQHLDKINDKEYRKLGRKGKNNTNQYPPKSKPRLKNNTKRISYDKKKNCNHHLDNDDALIHERNETTFNTINESEHFLALQPKTERNSSTSIHLENMHNSNFNIIKENNQIYNSNNNSASVDRSGDDKEKLNNLKNVPKALFTKTNRPYLGEGPEQLFNGITRVILNKGRVIDSSKTDLHKKRISLILPNTSLPKLTQFEIKRRLASLKFPIVILEKDQLTNCPIHVPKYDPPPQFNGLNEQIWPFMVEWPKDPETKNIITTKHKTKKKCESNDIHFQKCRQNIYFTEPQLTDVGLLNKKNHFKTNVSKLSTDLNTDIVNNESLVSKTKAIRLLHNKMLKFLHKNSASTKINECNDEQITPVKIDKIVGTNEKIDNEVYQLCPQSQESFSPRELNRISVANPIAKKPYSLVKHPWAKSKWASDFIDNIIRKIKCGVYYGVDHKELNYKIKTTEASCQTEKHILRNAFCQKEVETDLVSELVIDRKDDPLKNIPGFDNTHSTFEIETVTKNQISVKHCVTNVVVQFDVQVLAEANNTIHGDNYLSCIPINSAEHTDKLFKCQTRILNAILPAELCSIIPTMMQSILDSNVKMGLKSMETMDPCLSTASKLGGNEINNVVPHILPTYDIPEQLKPMIIGRFSIINVCKHDLTETEFRAKAQMESVIKLMPDVDIKALLQFSYGPCDLKVHKNKKIAMITYNSKDKKQSHNPVLNRTSCCMALQPYESKKHSLIASQAFSKMNFLKDVINKLNSNIVMLLYSNPCRITCYMDTCNITDHNHIIDLQCQGRSVHLRMNSPELLSLYSAFAKRNESKVYDPPLNVLQTTELENNIKPCIQNEKCRTDSYIKQSNKRNVKKKSYVKCYRKCNSMSSISNYKSTPLSRVTSLDEFCQVLGSVSLCSVLDSCLEKKILSAVREMKNYVTEITPKQALLLLLLTSKKDTSNLISFKPVLVQGIAVNRITRAVELDTEIDVIEREKFYKFSQYDVFSSSRTFAEKQDSLLEELFWIAKTTASDYQKNFDESSEKLLKSLLEKRKKLNPSYLRVMARYVGLGLLKPLK